MKVGVIVGCRYLKIGDQYYTTTSYHSEMWKEYLRVFDSVVILDQVIECSELEKGHKPILTDNVELVEFKNCTCENVIYAGARAIWKLTSPVKLRFNDCKRW